MSAVIELGRMRLSAGGWWSIRSEMREPKSLQPSWHLVAGPRRILKNNLTVTLIFQKDNYSEETSHIFIFNICFLPVRFQKTSVHRGRKNVPDIAKLPKWISFSWADSDPRRSYSGRTIKVTQESHPVCRSISKITDNNRPIYFRYIFGVPTFLLNWWLIKLIYDSCRWAFYFQ